MSDLIIKPLTKDHYKFKQPKHAHLPPIPIRMVIAAPSGSGKTVLLSNLLVNIYRDCFERIYIFSPSIGIDKTLDPIINYQKKRFPDIEEKLYFTEYHEEDLENIINLQKKIIEYQKETEQKNLFSICIVIDDFADNPSFSRQSKMLHQLFIRGRHNAISSLITTQRYNLLSPIIRVNAISLIIFRLRNNAELQTIIEENSAMIDKKKLLEIYNKATDERYNFLYINLNARNINDMFYHNFTHKFIIN